MWILYSMIAAVLWGLDYALAEKLLRTIDVSTLLMSEFFFGFIVTAAFSLTSGSYKTELPKLFSSTQNTGTFIVLAIVFIVAHILIVVSISSKSATLASLIEMSYPFFVALFSWVCSRKMMRAWVH